MCFVLMLGNGMGEGTQRVPAGNLRKNPQVNLPVPAGSRRLKSRRGEGISSCRKKHINPWVPARKLPCKVIFTGISASSISTGTCAPHLSWMEVMASENLTPVGIIRKTPMLCPIKTYVLTIRCSPRSSLYIPFSLVWHTEPSSHGVQDSLDGKEGAYISAFQISVRFSLNGWHEEQRAFVHTQHQ